MGENKQFSSFVYYSMTMAMAMAMAMGMAMVMVAAGSSALSGYDR